MACRLFLYVGLSLKTASFASEQGAAMICLRGKDVQWWLFPGFREVLRGRQAGKSDSDALLLKKEESGRHPLFMERDSFCVLLVCLSPCVHAILCAFNGRRQLSPSHARGCLKAAMQSPPEAFFRAVPVRVNVPPWIFLRKGCRKRFPRDRRSCCTRTDRDHSQVWRTQDTDRRRRRGERSKTSRQK